MAQKAHTFEVWWFFPLIWPSIIHDLNPCESEWKSNQKIFVFYSLSVDPRSENSALRSSLGTIAILRQQKDWVGGFGTGHFCWPINPKQFWTCPNFFWSVQIVLDPSRTFLIRAKTTFHEWILHFELGPKSWMGQKKSKNCEHNIGMVPNVQRSCYEREYTIHCAKSTWTLLWENIRRELQCINYSIL